MKVWIFSIVSFLLGGLLAGSLGIALFVDAAKNSVKSEMQAYSLVLDLTKKGESIQLTQLSCMALGVGLKNYDELNASFFSLSGSDIIEDIHRSFVAKVKAQINDRSVCKNT